MLRITEIFENGNIIRLRLDGRIAPDSFDALAEICRKHEAARENVVLIDMAGVTFMSEETAETLLALKGERSHIINGSPFVEMLLHSKQTDPAREETTLLRQADRQRRDGND